MRNRSAGDLRVAHIVPAPFDPEDGILGGALPAYRIYDTLDGRVAVAALEPHFRARLYRELKRAEGTDLSDVMRTRTARAWERWAARRDLPIARVTD